jgi:protein tyrosine phosphatase (PTP) superfamily phosphohydrolase (DUF442 family)
MKVESTPETGRSATTQPARRRRRGVWLLAAGVALILAIIVTWFLTSDRVFHVIPEEVLRSRQLEPDELRQVIQDEHLETVISLRGNDPSLPWLQAEKAVCAEFDVYHESVSFDVEEWPARHRVRRLVRLFDEAETPILVHCYRGVDRSGWASAIALMLADRPLDDAMVQLSPRYGHVCDRDSCPLHYFFDSYRRHLDRHALTESSGVFRQWVAEDYCPDRYRARLELLSDLPTQAAPGESLRATVRVTNQGTFSWRLTDLETTGDRLGARIIGPYEQLPEDPLSIFRAPSGPAIDVARSGLEFGVMAPDSERDFELRFSAPKKPGHYVLQIDMVDEMIHWFSDLGFPGILHELEVVDSPPATE